MSKSIERRLLLSVTIDNCVTQAFTVGGPGGGGKDTSNTGVRVIHEPSGAVGRAQESRSQLTNKQKAFYRMASSDKFVAWVKQEAARQQGQVSIDAKVEAELARDKLKVEYRTAKGWETVE